MSDFGLSPAEMQDAINLERLYKMTNGVKCDSCQKTPVTHCDTKKWVFVCANCSKQSTSKRNIGEDRFEEEDLDRLEAKYGNSPPPKKTVSKPAVIKKPPKEEKVVVKEKKKKPKKREPSVSSSDDSLPPPRSRSQPKKRRSSFEDVGPWQDNFASFNEPPQMSNMNSMPGMVGQMQQQQNNMARSQSGFGSNNMGGMNQNNMMGQQMGQQSMGQNNMMNSMAPGMQNNMQNGMTNGMGNMQNPMQQQGQMNAMPMTSGMQMPGMMMPNGMQGQNMQKNMAMNPSMQNGFSQSAPFSSSLPYGNPGMSQSMAGLPQMGMGQFNSVSPSYASYNPASAMPSVSQFNSVDNYSASPLQNIQSTTALLQQQSALLELISQQKLVALQQQLSGGPVRSSPGNPWAYATNTGFNYPNSTYATGTMTPPGYQRPLASQSMMSVGYGHPMLTRSASLGAGSLNPNFMTLENAQNAEWWN
eukprot:Platyproteum_vivax@DN713_c0_g1_i1.p1